MDTLPWKRRISALCTSKSKKKRKLILLYHAVGNSPHAMSVQQFSEQMQWLYQHCKVVSLKDLLDTSRVGEGIHVTISFDDGYACLYQNVAPILKQWNMPAIVYINTGWIAEKEIDRRKSNTVLGHYPNEAFLLWNEVRALQKLGWEIGSHGAEHLDLTEASDLDIDEQLAISKLSIEKKLKVNCSHFAYTWGRHSAKLRQHVQKAGYLYAAAAHHLPLGIKNNNYALPRMNIENRYALSDFVNIVQGKWDYMGKIHALKQQLARGINK